MGGSFLYFVWDDAVGLFCYTNPMNMNLNTQQIVLLCLLIAFVTSIATGITVVSLMDQSTTPITQTVNRVVERTIEKVVDPDAENKTVTQTPERIVETVVVNQEDLTIEAVQKNSKSLVRVHLNNRGEFGDFVTLGVVVSSKIVLVDKNMISEKGNYYVKTSSGNLEVEPIDFDSSSQFATLEIKNTDVNLTPANWGDSNSLQLAQSVISISGSLKNSISTGVINRFDAVEKGEGESVYDEVTNIYTGVDSANVLVGSIITNLQGTVIGFKNYNPNVAKTTFTPSNSVKAFLSERGI